MKTNVPLWISGGLLGTAGFFLYFKASDVHPETPGVPGQVSGTTISERSRRPSMRFPSQAEDSSLARQGQLWEPAARSVSSALQSNLAIRKEAFAVVRLSEVGEEVILQLSPDIPAIHAEITSQAVQADGTEVTHLRVPGDPQGQLIIQENEAAGFFLGQLYYEEHPVAYQFKKTNRGLQASRHPVSDLICSIIGKDKDKVTMGLPKPKVAEAPGKGKGGGGGGGGGGNGGGGGDSRTLSIADASVVEGTGGSRSLSLTLNLSSSDKKNSISVDFATSDGSATAPGDYTATSGTAVFPRRSRQTTISIPITTDDLLESDETFSVTLSNPVGASIGDGAATVTIVNDDLGASFSVFDVEANEGNSGSKTVSFRVELAPAATTNASVDFATTNGTAVAGSDYAATSGTLTFLTGETSKLVEVEVFGDTDFENSETFSLLLSNPGGAAIADGQATGLIVNDDSSPSGVPALNSLPGATAVAYLDMDGHVASGTSWNGGATIVTGGVIDILGATGMTNVWKRVSEDFAPFQINITTEESVYLAAPPSLRTRCVITPDNEWYGTAGGVAYLGSFNWSGDTPCWTFSDQLGNSVRYIAEASSHEIGHTLKLRHDGRSSPSEEYFEGQGSGQTGWAPIMGVGYYKQLVQWSKGEYLAANNTEDDLAIISGQNGFGYRVDDHGNTLGTASTLSQDGLSVSGSGLIGSENDTDVFRFTVTTTGMVSLVVQSPALSPNLDVLAEIRDANGSLVASDNDPSLLEANPVATLSPGTYYLHVSGTGKGEPEGTGYSSYGSIGPYTISGEAP